MQGNVFRAWPLRRQHDRADRSGGPAGRRHAAGGAERAGARRDSPPDPASHPPHRAHQRRRSAGRRRGQPVEGRALRPRDRLDRPARHRRPRVDHRPPQRAQPDDRRRTCRRPRGRPTPTSRRNGRCSRTARPCSSSTSPAAHSDGDTIVFFRRSDVVSTGAIFDASAYPRFDPARGGSIDGIIEGLNRVLDIAIPGENQEGGTVIVPGRGRLSDETDVANYRDMVTIVRDRVRAMVDEGADRSTRSSAPSRRRTTTACTAARRLDARHVRRSRLSRA